MKQVTDLTIDTEERLKGVIDLVFEKAIDEPSFSVAYGNMCRCLATVSADTKRLLFSFRTEECLTLWVKKTKTGCGWKVTDGKIIWLPLNNTLTSSMVHFSDRKRWHILELHLVTYRKILTCLHRLSSAGEKRRLLLPRWSHKNLFTKGSIIKNASIDCEILLIIMWDKHF